MPQSSYWRNYNLWIKAPSDDDDDDIKCHNDITEVVLGLGVAYICTYCFE